MGRNKKLPVPTGTLFPREASTILGMTQNALAHWVRLGRLQTVKRGRWNMYPADEIRRLVYEGFGAAEARRRHEILDLILFDREGKSG